jgi:DNA polymerase IV
VRLLGVNASGLIGTEGQLNLLEAERSERWRKAVSAMDRLKDKFGEGSIHIAAGMRGNWREKVHENPVGLPGKDPREEDE